MRLRDTARGLVVAAVAIVLMTGAIASGTQGHADERAVKEEVLQNDPDGDRDEIRSRLIELIDETKNSSGGEVNEIMIASYHLDDTKVAEALKRAVERKVRVRFLVDDVDDDKPAYDTLKAAVDKAAPGSWLETCDDETNEPVEGSKPNKRTSCMGRHIMHNKFFLFKRTDGADNVVVQTSANLNDHSGTKMWNTAYITPDAWLYKKYKQYFEDLAAHRTPNDQEPDYYNVFQNRFPPVSNGKFKFYVSPRKTGNTFLDVLNDVRCDGNTSGGTDGDHRTIVRVAAMQIAGGNGIKIAQRLWELDNQGCYVDIVADEISHQDKRGDTKGALEYLLKRPEAMPPDRRNFHGPEVREFSNGQCGLHQKNLLIDGYYDGKKNQKVVFTGSHNLNNKSPRYNDEVILRITDSSVHQKFKEHFFKLRAGASITWQTSKFDVEPKRDPGYDKTCR